MRPSKVEHVTTTVSYLRERLTLNFAREIQADKSSFLEITPRYKSTFSSLFNRSTVRGKILEGEKIDELSIIHQFFIHQLFRNTRKYRYLINVKNFKIDKLGGLLKYFKRRCDMQKKDVGTLSDPDGPLSRNIPSSSIGIANTHVRKVQQKASSDRLRGPYISLTRFLLEEKGSRKRCNCDSAYVPASRP